MVYLSSWQDYQEAAEALYEKSPETTRYCVKWRAADAKLVLKITDNTTCLKFKTTSSVFLNRFEALNLSLMQKMTNRKPKPQAAPSQIDVSRAAPERTTTPVPSPAGVASGGVKKKKPKKKKGIPEQTMNMSMFVCMFRTVCSAALMACLSITRTHAYNHTLQISPKLMVDLEQIFNN
ncbi:signal recognition particle, SRP9/SRP14 subunit [Fomitopsis betulina]|nr:signal recognition particle, SRP9/SRP14 subunit [Fomitopsis betulina]